MSSAIRSRGRRGHTIVPNWRWEDTTLDPYELRIAGWLASHADQYLQAYVTRNEIARRTGISAPKVSEALRKLEELGIVTVQLISDRNQSRFEITFDFEAWEREPDSQGWEPDYRGVVATLPGGGSHATATIEEHREEHLEILIDADDQKVFDQFWAAYPRKVAKPTARRAFEKKFREHGNALNAGLAAWNEYWDASKQELQFIPHPATWLNQERYLDEPPPVAVSSSKSARSISVLQRMAAGELGVAQ